jgi:tetratricopeptide (TPR) repeat protein
MFLAIPVPAMADKKTSMPDIRLEQQHLDVLINAGALELSIRTLDRSQKENLYDAQWEAWERLRFKLYRRQQNWEALKQRFAAYPKEVSPDFYRWAVEQVSIADLEQGHGAEARRYLRELLWQGGASKKKVAELRRLVIESYLTDNRVNDANKALVQYQQDFPGTSSDWQVLQGRVLLRSGRYRDAFDVLSGQQRLDAKLYRLTAALRAGIYQPDVVIKSAERLGKVRFAEPLLVRKSWALVAEAAWKSGNRPLRLSALEQALNIRLKSTTRDPLFPVNADTLWKAYFEYAETVGNDKRLLVGDDSSWLKQAEGLEKTRPVQARGLYAFLAIKGAVDIVRAIAHKRFTDSLYKEDLGNAAVALYTESEGIARVQLAPDDARYRLAIEILRKGDIKVAAEIMKSLTQPPADESVEEWKLRRARTLVYAGQFPDAVVLLNEALGSVTKLNKEFVQRFTQVLFDLQAVGEHAAAIELFESVYHKVQSTETQRELLYWMAESYAARGDNARAAALYLQSAVHGQPSGGDMWGQSARYHAAESLAHAGLIEDARAVYGTLLRQTPDAKRRALIERNLQQLWLQKEKQQTQ